MKTERNKSYKFRINCLTNLLKTILTNTFTPNGSYPNFDLSSAQHGMVEHCTHVQLHCVWIYCSAPLQAKTGRKLNKNNLMQ